MPAWVETLANSPGKTLRAFCLFFMAGSGAATLWAPTAETTKIFFFLLFLTASFLAVLWPNKTVRLVGLIIFALIFGIFRGGLAAPNCLDKTSVCARVGESGEVVGRVSKEPNVRLKDIAYTVAVTQLDGTKISTGNVLLSAPLYPRFNYGDTLQFHCKLEGPMVDPNSSFRYDKYLTSQGVQALCRYPAGLKLMSAGSVYQPLAIILGFKSALANQVGRLWSEPAASLMAGLLYGAQSNLPSSIRDEFSVSGLSHIIAVSGFNVSIIALVLLAAFTRAGWPRRRAVLAALIAIWIFVLMVGGSASAVRAGIMASVVLAAELLGRLSDIAGTLILAAAVMVAINPYVLLWDIGFQLSFAATLGLVYFSPLVEDFFTCSVYVLRKALLLILSVTRQKTFFYFVQKKYSVSAANLALDKSTTLQKNFFLEVFTTTLSAVLATLPILLYYFGSFSPLAIFANILVVPLVPVLMLAGAVALLASLVFFPLGLLAAWIANIGLWYILLVVQWLGRPSLAFKIGLQWWGVIVWYLIYVWYVQKKRKNFEFERGV